LIVTDSGGVQEEAPTFGVPILVVRNESERPEAITAGFAQLTGTEPDRILAAARDILQRGGKSELRGKVNPFGDGTAADRIVRLLLSRTDAGAAADSAGEPIVVNPPELAVDLARFVQ
jgi:UDP-N-acetylglucosamine 2-epimerase (non-hydrolysing)